MYTDFFKFEKKPFHLTPSAAVFYQGSEVKQCYDKLLKGVQAGEELILLTGDQGTGKTLFAQKLQADLQEDKYCQCISLSFTSLSLDNMLEYICAELQLKHGLGRNEDALEILDIFLNHGVSPIKSVVIIIDEAQNLSADILNCLSKLIDMGAKAERIVQIILLARNEQEMQFDRPELASLKKKISLHCETQPFPAEQIEGYIEFQLQKAGASETTLFSSETCARIFQYTSGSPRAINLICDQVLAMAANDHVDTITPEQIDAVHQHSEFQDTLETRTSMASEAIAQFESHREKQPEKRSEEYSGPANNLVEPDTVPEPEIPADLQQHFEEDPELIDTVKTERRHWQDTQTIPNRKLSPVHAEVRTFSDSNPGKLKWAAVIAVIMVLSLLGLLYSQVKFQKETIADLEKKLVNLNEAPETDNGVLVQEKTSIPAKDLSPPLEPQVPEPAIPKVAKVPLVTAAEKIKPQKEQEKKKPVVAQVPEAKLNQAQVTIKESENNVVVLNPQSKLTITEVKDPLEEEQHADPAEIEKLLITAREQSENDQLTEPKGENAIETFQRVLELDPKNTQAQQGITKIKENFILWAKNSEKNKELQRARYQYGKAQQIDPYDQELAEKVAELDKKASPRERGETLTIVLEYARTGNTKNLAELLEKGAFVDVRDKSGNTALMIATDRGHLGAVKVLIENEADINLANKIGDTALMNAVWSNHQEIAKLLIENDAKINATNKHGWTALMYAAIHGHTSLLKALSEAGATPGHRTNDGKTPLAAAAHNGQREVVSILLKQGSSIDAKDEEDWTPLMHAVWNNHATVVQLLLLNNAEVNNQNNEKWTPLMLAAWNGFDTIVEMLLDYGADKSVKNIQDDKALDLARKQHHQSIVGLLQ